MAVIVITGGSGLLAVNWAKYRGSQDTIHLWLNSRDLNVEKCSSKKVDLSSRTLIGAELDRVKPDIVINLAAFTDVDGCEFEYYRSKFVNSTIAANIAHETGARQIKLVHVSTDQLFDLSVSWSKETTKVSPLNNYGYHKAEAEILVLQNNKDALVIRTSFFGWGPSYRRSFSDKIIDSLEDNRCISLFDDVFFTPVEATELIDLVHQLVESGKFGIYNISSSEKISKYSFGVLLAKSFGLDETLIQPVQASRVRDTALRSHDLSMDNQKVCSALGIEKISISLSVKRLKKNTILRKEIQSIGKFIPYGRHFIDRADVHAVNEILLNAPLTQGPMVEQFERKFANAVGAKFAVAVSSATAGLHLAYKALGLKNDLSVLVSPITFLSTANAAHYCGGTAQFADIDPTTINIDPIKVEEAVTRFSNIHILAPTLFSGSGEGIRELSVIAQKHNLRVVEDAAHGLGASYPCGALVGSCKYSDCTVFSLHPVKTIAAGEGGVVVTNNKDVYRSLLRSRSHGVNKADDVLMSIKDAYTDGELNLWYYEMQELGYHYRFTDIQAALANSQLNKLKKFILRRRNLVKRYVEWILRTPNIKRAHEINIDDSANHLMPVLIDFNKIGMSRNIFMGKLRKKGIITQVHYIPLVNQPFYSSLGHVRSDFPESQKYFDNCLSLPLFYGLSDQDFDFVTTQLESLLYV
jgi:dTDP-4-dehydrorhamnose reductase